MIEFMIEGHELDHEIQTIAQVFYPNRHYYLTDKISDETITIISKLTENTSQAIIYDKGTIINFKTVEYNNKDLSLKEKKRIIKSSIYEALKEVTGYIPPWGMLTGIRPAKTINELLDDGYSEEYAFKYLTEKYDVTSEKAKLALEVAKAERDILSKNSDNDVSIYIGIPFCPSRCLYCSFTSYPLCQYIDKVDIYIDALIKEMEFIGDYSVKCDLRTIYVGGGTPTSLNEIQLERLLSETVRIFDLSKVSEFTVEAGRPDTITYEKLCILKKYGVNRISINPQTMNDKTLEAIGRKHTVYDIVNVFNLARKAGHKNINMDIILGLPGETAEDVENTMHEIEKLSPDNVTVHTLAVKRASRLKENFENYKPVENDEMEKMLEISYNYALKMGMKPYYMYRQKNMVGSYENVGYCLPGTEGVYNVEIMEEKQTIFAAGAGATTKTVDFATNRIDRIFNVKNVDEYINRIDEMIKRKKDGIYIEKYELGIDKEINF